MEDKKKYRTILLEKINKLLQGDLTVSQFRDEYYSYFLDTVPNQELTKGDSIFFGLIQEQLDWTTENPDKEDKKYRYKNYQEYTNWVRQVTELFLKEGANPENDYDSYLKLWTAKK